ncbi:MAG: hypothetical protein PHY08_03535 [Candidatus Cloacimonetes bacterium]|nr:hypothetical protein [Candidatus Cloacimonadota bacterium]MDD4155626.1 hypothetical protein [Candidatus Cloacimonadota bacterium]
MKYKNLLILFICAVISILIIGGLVYSSKLKSEHKKVTTYFNNALIAINEIQDSLMVIDNQDSIIKNIAHNTDYKEDLSSKEQIMISINNIKEYIADNKMKLTHLEEQLMNNNLQISGLQKLINNLKLDIKHKEDIILSMQNQIEELNIIISNEREKSKIEILERDEQLKMQASMLSSLQNEVLQKDDKLKAQLIEEYTIYYFIGNEKQLINNEFLTKKTFFKSAKRTGKYNQEVMIQMNLLDFQEIIINASFKDITFLTDQDRSSYIIEDWGEQSLLKVINPNEFKKIKYLVIKTD